MARIIETESIFAEKEEPCKTVDQMEQICCEPKPKLECCEKVVDPNWQGFTADEVRDKLGAEENPYIEYRPKARKNPCGKLTHKYDLTPKNCCDEVEPLEIDTEASVSVLEPDTHGNVYFTGGKFPVLVKVRGNGFTLDGYNQREGWIDGPNRGFTVYAHEFACGSAPITLDDGCSVAQGSVRSTVGRWTGYCYSYYWNPATLYYLNDYPHGVFGAAINNCVIYGYIEQRGWTGNVYRNTSGHTYLLRNYIWNTDDGYWEPHGSSGIQSGYYIPEYWEMVLSYINSTGIPANTLPNIHSPNGPTESKYCSHPEFRCEFIC